MKTFHTPEYDCIVTQIFKDRKHGINFHFDTPQTKEDGLDIDLTISTKSGSKSDAAAMLEKTNDHVVQRVFESEVKPFLDAAR